MLTMIALCIEILAVGAIGAACFWAGRMYERWIGKSTY